MAGSPHPHLSRRAAASVIHLASSSSSSSSSSSAADEAELASIAPFELPQVTVKELLAAIPAHCFERSALRSSLYLLWDLVLSGSLVGLATLIDPFFDALAATSSPALVSLARFSAWALYAYAVGLVWTGIWVIAHECGHQSFSTSKRVNNTVGWVLHSALLVPYHSWRISHAQHHAATGHLTRDQVFVPKTRSQRGLPPLSPHASKREREGALPASVYNQVDDLLEDAPVWNLFNLLLQQLLGWPMYILTNASGQSRYPAWTNHFNPNAILYDQRHRSQVLSSDLGIGLMLATLTFIGYRSSFMTVVKYYLAPYVWVNHWLVMITFLQHTDPLLPHYREGAFNFQRGALCTIDRRIHGFFFHGIAETHVAHHTCSKIPHYHAWDATAALKAKLGPHYHQTDENAWVSLWKCYNQCRFVEDEGDVVFFKNAKGQAARRLVNPDKGSVSDSGVELNDVSSAK